MVVFMYQIPLQRRKAQAKLAPRCQLSSCQGNEREMWRRGHTPMYSKRSPYVVCQENSVSFYFLVSGANMFTVLQNVNIPLKWPACDPQYVWPHRQSDDFQMDSDLSRYTHFLALFTHCPIENTGNEFEFWSFYLQIWRGGSASQNEMLQVMLFLHQITAPSVS